MRLTIKKDDKYCIAYKDNKGVSLKYFSTATEEVKQIIDNSNDIFQKLGQLEDIEEELGIELVTLFNALKNGVYHKKYNCGYAYSLIPVWWTNGIKFHIVANGKKINIKLKDYGKTWALTKEELL